MGLIEYTFSPHWFFAFVDQYNGGYTNEGKTYEAVHYLNISCGYSKGTNRFELGYGKVRGLYHILIQNGLFLYCSHS